MGGALKARHTERKKREKSKKAGSKEKEASGAAGSGRKLDESFEKTAKDPCFMEMCGAELNTEERWVLRTSQEELGRAKNTVWRCLFPTRHSISYATYFDGPRPLNALLARVLWWSA